MKLKSIITVVALSTLWASCSNDEPSAEKGYGTIAPEISADYDVKATWTVTKATTAPAVIQPEIGDFSARLLRKDGSVDKTWSKVTDMSQAEKFPVGDYTISASYGDMADEGFDKPYFYGSASFTLYDGEVAQPEVVATLQNTMVSVDYTEAFIHYFADYSTTILSTQGNYITFVKGENRAAYVKPGEVKIALELTNQEGKTVTVMPASITGAKARYHYRVTFDVNGGEVCDAQLVITFNEELSDGGEVIIALGDELFNAEVPSAKAVDFTPGTSVNYIEGDEPTTGPRMNLGAMAGFSEVILTTQSDYLINNGWPAEIDLKNIDPAQKALLLNYGLKVSGLWGGASASKMALIDFTGVVPKLRATEAGENHKFTVLVKDILTRVSEPLELELVTTPVQLELPETTTTVAGTGVAECTVTYNGVNIADNVTFSVLKENGTWSTCSVAGVRALGGNQYKVTLNVPISSTALQVRAEYKGGLRTSESMAVTPTSPNLTISAPDVDIWGSYMILTLASDQGDVNALANIASVYVSADGGSTYSKASNVTVSGNTLTVGSLTPGTAYKMKVSVVNSDSDTSNELAAVTESAVQLPNSDMESWSKSNIYSVLGTKYYEYFPYASGESDVWWATNNERTIAYSLARVSQTSGCAVSYNKTVKRSGNYSAQIYTSGHGGGYASTVTIIYPEGAVAGALFIGTYDWSNKTETITTGHAFSTRPLSLSFWYEYMPKNTDQFKVEVEVRSGDSVIGRGEYIPASTSTADTAFRQATVNIDYTNKKAKATEIFVRFLSTTMTSFSSSDFNKSTSTAIGDETLNVHIGSILYVDDLSLNY